MQIQLALHYLDGPSPDYTVCDNQGSMRRPPRGGAQKLSRTAAADTTCRCELAEKHITTRRETLPVL